MVVVVVVVQKAPRLQHTQLSVFIVITRSFFVSHSLNCLKLLISQSIHVRIPIGAQNLNIYNIFKDSWKISYVTTVSINMD